MHGHTWSRRSFLSAALGSAVGVLGRRPAAAAPPAVRPSGRLRLYHTHTRERIEVAYREEAGRYDATALRRVNTILRCHFTGQVARIDPRVIELVDLVATVLGAGHELHIVSGFRSPEYNAWLIRRGHGVSPRSLHLLGRAVDLRIPAVPLAEVRRAALALRRGGVGYYPPSDFVHLDSGRFRTW